MSQPSDSNNRNLPLSDQVNVGTLSRLFWNTTNSYKYLFFLALLDAISKADIHDTPISLDDLETEMLIYAWYPSTYFRLSFGSADQISKYLKSLQPKNLFDETILDSSFKKRLRTLIKTRTKDLSGAKSVVRYVPTRLLRPFFERELKNVKDPKVDALISNLSRELFNSVKPLYKLTEDGFSIIVHPEWFHFLKTNITIVRSWAYWEWLIYMQERNPSVPAISKKLLPKFERGALANARKYWSLVLEHSSLHCIYTGKVLSGKIAFSLDHFLPWSFVAHDERWNLIPVDPSVNITKSDCIPEREYIKELVDVQHYGIVEGKRVAQDKMWEAHIKSFISELKMPKHDLLDKQKLFNAYESMICPLMDLAVSHGFRLGWP
jgi:hypothetical protein